jgi:LPS-assembly lipoprotein
VRAGERELLAPQTLTLATEYSFDETALLAKQQEQDQLRAALARDLAGQVIRRLAAIPPTATATPAPAGAAPATAAPSPAAPSPSPPPAAAPPRP